MISWLLRLCRDIDIRRLLCCYSVFQVICCAIRVLAASYASIVHDKIYLLLFIGASLYLCSAAIGLIRPSERNLFGMEEALFHQKCVHLTVVNVISFCIEILTIAYLTSWQAFYESRTYLIISLASVLGVQLVIQFFVIWILAEYIESCRHRRSVIPLADLYATGVRMHHDPELGASTSSPLPREPVDLNSVDRPATPFSNPPATVRLSVCSETSNNLNRSNSDPVNRRSLEDYGVLKMPSS